MESITGSKPYLFTYDALDRGSVVDNGNRTFDYNLANQMFYSDGITFQYDGHDRRVIKTVEGNTTISIYTLDGQLLYRQKPNGDHIDYVYINGQLLSTVESR